MRTPPTLSQPSSRTWYTYAVPPLASTLTISLYAQAFILFYLVLTKVLMFDFKSLGVKCMPVDGICDSKDTATVVPKYDATCVRHAIDAILEQSNLED